MTVIAQPDDIVTCERGHPLYRITAPVLDIFAPPSAAFEPIDPRAERPIKYTMIRGTCHCGADWFRGRPRHKLNQLHLEGGWSPQ